MTICYSTEYVLSIYIDIVKNYLKCVSVILSVTFLQFAIICCLVALKYLNKYILLFLEKYS